MSLHKRTLLLFLFLPWLTACERKPEIRGLYYWGAEVNVVCPCGSSECFWVRGTPEVLARLRTFVAQETSEPYQPVHLHYRGVLLDEPATGFAADYEGYQEISEVLTISVTLPADCPPPA